MILTSITPMNFGPYTTGQTLNVDAEVTVLTGPNDCGKTSLLKAIHLACTRAGADEREYNRDRIGMFQDRWQVDPDLKCLLSFKYVDGSKWKHRLVANGDIVNVSASLSPDRPASVVESLIKVNRQTQNIGEAIPLPTSLWFPMDHAVGERIKLTQMNPAEDRFIRLGFGAEFSFAHYKSLSEDNRADYVRDRELKLNGELSKIMPPSVPLSFSLRAGDVDKLDILRVGLVDKHRGSTPLGSRGAGIRKLISFMGSLLSLSAGKDFTLILLDEPETSLHAEAQHTLRRVLEGLGSRPNIQVLYATHSPSMVNTLRPTSIRVLKRDRVDEKATSVIINNAFDKNFFAVRSSLGLSPADSLLYAPITVVVEGLTEVRCLRLVFEKLKVAGIGGFEDVDAVLAQTHILEGGGDSFEYLCRLAKSQGAKPVVFLDGDKRRGSSARLMTRVREDHPDVPVVTLLEGEEFEQLVPAEKYIEAVALDLEDTSGTLTVARFDEWKVKHPYHAKKAFSKLVEEWVCVEFNERLNKPRVMQRALEITDATSILPAKLQELLAEMRKLGSLL